MRVTWLRSTIVAPLGTAGWVWDRSRVAGDGDGISQRVPEYWWIAWIVSLHYQAWAPPLLTHGALERPGTSGAAPHAGVPAVGRVARMRQVP
jgi:hypothetical protein